MRTDITFDNIGIVLISTIISLHKGGAMASNRTALLVRCTAQEAEAIRRAAKRERRSISGFVLNAVMNRLASQAAIMDRVATPAFRGRVREGTPSDQQQ